MLSQFSLSACYYFIRTFDLALTLFGSVEQLTNTSAVLLILSSCLASVPNEIWYNSLKYEVNHEHRKHNIISSNAFLGFSNDSVPLTDLHPGCITSPAVRGLRPLRLRHSIQYSCRQKDGYKKLQHGLDDGNLSPSFVIDKQQHVRLAALIASPAFFFALSIRAAVDRHPGPSVLLETLEYLIGPHFYSLMFICISVLKSCQSRPSAQA